MNVLWTRVDDLNVATNVVTFPMRGTPRSISHSDRLSFLQDCNDVQVVVLHKDVGVGMGFSMAGGVDQNKPVTVRKPPSLISPEKYLKALS